MKKIKILILAAMVSSIFLISGCGSDSELDTSDVNGGTSHLSKKRKQSPLVGTKWEISIQGHERETLYFNFLSDASMRANGESFFSNEFFDYSCEIEMSEFRLEAESKIGTQSFRVVIKGTMKENSLSGTVDIWSDQYSNGSHYKGLTGTRVTLDAVASRNEITVDDWDHAWTSAKEIKPEYVSFKELVDGYSSERTDGLYRMEMKASIGEDSDHREQSIVYISKDIARGSELGSYSAGIRFTNFEKFFVMCRMLPLSILNQGL